MSETRVRPALHGKDLILAVLRWILIIFFALYTLFPLVWLFISSLKTNFEFLAGSPFSLPAVPQWQNYVNALAVAGLVTYAEEVVTILSSSKYLPGVPVFRVYSLNLLLRPRVGMPSFSLTSSINTSHRSLSAFLATKKYTKGSSL